MSKPRNKTLMRIFLNMDITEHTGHGIPTIIEKYGKDVFEITDTSIRCTIPFSNDVLSRINDRNVGLDVSLNVALSKTEYKILESLLLNPHENAGSLSTQIGVVRRTIERALKSLQEKGFVERYGSRRDGYWTVKKLF